MYSCNVFRILRTACCALAVVLPITAYFVLSTLNYHSSRLAARHGKCACDDSVCNDPAHILAQPASRLLAAKEVLHLFHGRLRLCSGLRIETGVNR